MKSFVIKPKIVFDNNSTTYIRTLTEDRFFIITDPFIVTGGLIKRVTEEIDGKDHKIFDKVVPDPPVEVVAECIKNVIEYQPKCIIAIGGGSAIDTAKAVILYSKIKAKFIAIPTTSGTGSEVTSFSVISDKNSGTKLPLVDDKMLPDVAILDTEYVKTVPDKIVADTGLDVLTHAIEAYVSTASNDFSDAFAEKAIKLTWAYLPKSFKDCNDHTAKDKMHKASLMAGLSFNNASLGLNHAIAHNVGGRLKIPHGRINAMLLPKIIEFNSGVTGYNAENIHPSSEKYATIAKIIGIQGSNTKLLVRGLIRETEKLISKLGMPLTFKDCGIGPSEVDFEAIATSALKDNCINTNPKKATKEDIITILKKLC